MFCTLFSALEEFCGPVVTLGGCGPVMGQNNGMHPSSIGCFPGMLFDPCSPIPTVTGGCVSGNTAMSAMNSNSVKTKKIMYDLLDNEEFDREEIPTYEEVARLFPRPGVFRPIVLVGAPGVGRNELKRRLMALEAERYKATIPRELNRP